jgi:hypothetical protein
MPGVQVVKYHHRLARFGEFFHDVAADVPCSTRNENIHDLFPCWIALW